MSMILTALLCLNITTPKMVESYYVNNPVMETPVMRINVYMMGMTEVDPEITVLVNENIDFLNEEFEGVIEFEFNQFFMDHEHAYLPDLHKEFMNFEEASSIDNLIKPIEVKGAINVFLFDTYAEKGTNQALMGFTPRLKEQQDTYSVNSPNFDRIFMAYEGLGNKSTLVHEMGHFLGLHHPWELSGSTKLAFGIRTNVEESHNHMSYGPDVNKFTSQQLESMRKHALQYRKYLMDRVVSSYVRT